MASPPQCIHHARPLVRAPLPVPLEVGLQTTPAIPICSASGAPGYDGLPAIAPAEASVGTGAGDVNAGTPTSSGHWRASMWTHTDNGMEPECANRGLPALHPRHHTYDFSSCFLRKFKKSAKRGFSRAKTYFCHFYVPKVGGGGPPTRVLSINITNSEIWPSLRYFCLLWAGPAEQCCTPVYLPIEDFRQKFAFFPNFLVPKFGWRGISRPRFLPNHQKPWNSAYSAVFLSALGWCCRTVLHTSVPV